MMKTWPRDRSEVGTDLNLRTLEISGVMANGLLVGVIVLRPIYDGVGKQLQSALMKRASTRHVSTSWQQPDL